MRVPNLLVVILGLDAEQGQEEAGGADVGISYVLIRFVEGFRNFLLWVESVGLGHYVDGHHLLQPVGAVVGLEINYCVFA